MWVNPKKAENQEQGKSKEQRRRRRELIIIFFLLALIGLLFYLLTPVPFWGDQIPVANNILVVSIISLNTILLLLLVLLILRIVVKVIFERKRKVLGSKLRTKLVLAFISLSLVPTILLFFIA